MVNTGNDFSCHSQSPTTSTALLCPQLYVPAKQVVEVVMVVCRINNVLWPCPVYLYNWTSIKYSSLPVGYDAVERSWVESPDRYCKYLHNMIKCVYFRVEYMAVKCIVSQNAEEAAVWAVLVVLVTSTRIRLLIKLGYCRCKDARSLCK